MHSRRLSAALGRSGLFRSYRRPGRAGPLTAAAVAAVMFGVAGLGAGASTPARAEATPPNADPVDPLALYGPAIEFDVYRKGSRVGFHRVRFARAGDAVVATTRFKLSVDFLFFTAYRFAYESVARWHGGQMVSLRATADDNGDHTAVRATLSGDAVAIDGPKGKTRAPAPLYPTSHWNAGVLGEDRVLNTLTGRVNAVAIAPVGREDVVTERGPVAATRYAYGGELETEVWYDEAGRWVKMRFAARDGSAIDYVCRRCQGGAQAEARND